MKLLVAVLAALALAAPLRPAAAQTDYYNTDAGRPVEVEDAHAIERHAFELQLAPVRLERQAGGTYHYGVEPEIAYGLLPRTQLELGAPLAYVDRGAAGHSIGLAGLEASVLHALNTETRLLPALAVSAGVLAPVGALGPDEAYASVKGIVTRSFSWARIHVNAERTFGDTAATTAGAEGAAAEVSRWRAGLAVDKTFPLRSMLVTAEVVARQPLHEREEVVWSTGSGIRYQWSPRLALDVGVAHRFGAESAWVLTFGSAYAFGLRALVPVPGQ